MKPQDALPAARARAADRRARGDYADVGAPEPMPAGEGVTLERLMEWASLEPDVAALYSTRRLGAPVTFVKRMLARGLQQYLNELVGQQSRFNVQLVAYLGQLADRVERLEEESALRREGDGP